MSLLAAALTLLLAAGAPPAPSLPSLDGATKAAAIPSGPINVPPKGDPQPGINKGTHGATNVLWSFPDAPHDGLDAMRITISPRVAASPKSNYIYWAFDSVFMNNVTWYTGLQPAGEFGKTALFSVFGKDTSSTSTTCKSGADSGSGTSCHIHYEWVPEKSYELLVTLVAADAGHTTWEGAIIDLQSHEQTVIGDVTVLSSRGYLKPWGGNFAEYFRHVDSCEKQPYSEALFYRPVGYRGGKEYKAKISALNDNNSCDPVFYTDGSSDFVYVGEGSVDKPSR